MPLDAFRLERGSLLILLDEAVTVARAMVRPLFLGLVLPPALAGALMAAAQGFLMGGFFQMAPQSNGDFSMFLGHFALFFLVMFFYMTLLALASAATFAGAAQELQGERLSALACWRWVLRPRNAGTIFLMGLFITIGSIFCLLPGIYLMVVWAIVLPVMLRENLLGLEALSRSRQLVIYGPDKPLFSPGMGWVLLVGITVVVLNYGVSMAIQFPLGIIQQILLTRHIMGQVQTGVAANPMQMFPSWFFVLQSLSAFAAGMAQMLVVFFSASAYHLLYLRLKGRREGHDLIAALDRLGIPE